MDDNLKITEVTEQELTERVILDRIQKLENRIGKLILVDNKEVQTPESIKEHETKYKKDIWLKYSIHELGMWVHLFLKRALQRSDKVKAEKDVTDAQNYLNMMQAQVDSVRKQVFEMK